MALCRSHYHGKQCELEAKHVGLCGAVIKGALQFWTRGEFHVLNHIPGQPLGPLPPLADECYSPISTPLPPPLFDLGAE